MGSSNCGKRLFREALEDRLDQSIPERLVALIQRHPERELDILLSILPYCYSRLAPVDGARPISEEEEDAVFLRSVANDPDPLERPIYSCLSLRDTKAIGLKGPEE